MGAGRNVAEPALSGRFDVPAIIRAQAAAIPGGAAWLAGLPRLLTALEQTWAVRITEWIPGGTTSVVVRATRSDGRPVVIKVAVPGFWFDKQVQTLAAANGNGYVRLLAYDGGRHAALLEALGPSLHESGLPPSAQLSVLGRLVRRAWRMPPGPEQARDKATELAELVLRLWEQLGHPCSEQVAQHLLPAIARMADERCR